MSSVYKTLPVLGSKKTEKRAFLIHSPVDLEAYADSKQHYAPSAGLIAIQSSLKRSCRHISSEILDGALLSKSAIVQKIQAERPDFVCQSIQQISYPNAIEIATVAKSVGSMNILGGQHATQMAGEIMANRHAIIDAVIRHDGEIPLAMICAGVPIAQVANATYWDDGVHNNEAVEWDLDTYPAPDFSQVDLKPYVDRYTTRLGLSSPQTFLRTHSHRGCGNRNGSHACYFCGRADKLVRFKTPDKFVSELVELRQRWGADAVFDTGDDIAFSVAWLREVAERIEACRMRLEIGCFGRACRLLDPEVARLLRRMGVTNVIIGFESGDADTLRGCGKGGVTPEDNLVAAGNLFDNGIDVLASYVLGLPGETEHSLQRTYENAQDLLELATRRLGRPPYELVANLFEPTPGSPAFRRVKEVFPERYLGVDMIDLAQLQEDYFLSHWNLPTESSVREFRGLLVEWGGRLNSLTIEADPQGYRAEESARRTVNAVSGSQRAA